MIITFVIVLIALVGTLYVSTMHALWKQQNGIELTAFSVDPVLVYTDKAERLTRRAYYQSTFHGKSITEWANKRMAGMFFLVFPNAQPAFAKRNTLAGLKEGPSSYFLMSISETKNEHPKSTRRKRKIV